MKKRILMALCLLLILGLTAMQAAAAGSVSAWLSADSTSVSAGSTVNVTVSAEVDSCGSGGVSVSFDSSVFELTGGSCTVSGADLSYFDASTRDGAFAFAGTNALSGGVFQFTLKVKDSAAPGSHAVSVTFSADGTSVTKSVSISLACDHAYDNSCDETCNICGSTREVSHSWDSGTVTAAATCSKEGVKTFSCTSCGKTKTEAIAKTSHSYTGKVTKAATCSEEGVEAFTCSACGDSYTESVETLDHDYEIETYISATCSEEGSITFVCADCGASYDDYIEKQAHTYDNDCDQMCNVCGETRETEHQYDQWSSDETSHWYECESCGERTEPQLHTSGPEATETEDQVCLDCAYVLAVAGTHTHKEEGNWLSNDGQHWYLCTCGELMGEEAHKWELKKEEADKRIYICSVCNRTKTEQVETAPTETTAPPTEQTEPPAETAAPAVQPSEKTGTYDWWWIIVAVLAVGVVGAGGYVIVGLLLSGRKTGRYASKKK